MSLELEPPPVPVRPAPPGFPFLLVTGGKGGVGKSAVAANLAACLARRGASPLLVDLDFGLGNLASVFGRVPEHDLEAFFAGRRSLRECVLCPAPNLDVLFAGTGSIEMGRPDPARSGRLLRALSEVVAPEGIVVGDSPAGIGPEMLAFAAAARRVLVVTTPDPAAVTDAFGVIKALDTHAREHGLEIPTPEIFVNFADNRSQARTIADHLTTVCQRFLDRAPRFGGWMPRARAVLLANVRQKLFLTDAPRSVAARQIEKLAERLHASLGRSVLEGHGR